MNSLRQKRGGRALVRLPWPKRFAREFVVVVRRQRQTPEHIQRFVENILL
jgi:hypothetical protein